jgi:WD40 repeat protein/DNA-binding SARP family transcriptional activator
VRYRLLGPLEVCDGDRPVRLGEGRQRSVLILLLLHRNEAMERDRLIDALWGESPPATAAKVLQNYIGQLRRALEDREGRRLQTRGHGYAIRVEDGELDLDRFERLVREGGEALARERPADAARCLREALGLWRGPALADVAYEPFAQPEIARLDEQRAVALERRIDADLALGRHADLVAELEGLVAQHPLRERLRGQQMLALYRCGRQSEALEAFHQGRRLLVEEIGVEPGPSLRGLHEAILRQDAALEVESEGLPEALRASAAAALVGRERELAWLRVRWGRARAGAGELVVVSGPAGMGKTRLAAELAAEVQRAGGAVLYATGWARPDVAVAAARRAREAMRPTLLVVDDADASDAALAVVAALAFQLSGTPVLGLAIAHGQEGLVAHGDDVSLALEPLGADAVRGIAAGYAPGRTVADIDVEELLETSGGVPGQVHELASAWARRQAARRVGSFAPRASAGRAEVRRAEAELVEGVVDFQAAAEHADLIAAHESPLVCPFKGLACFDVADARYFFGRERLVAELVARAVGTTLLGVVGPSGSGKSSVVRAGLLPALASGVLPGIEDWPQVLIRPGEHPMRELHSSGLEERRDDRVVLAVDQFEEIFTACRDEAERAAFVDALARRPREAGGLVVLAVRADFYARCAAYPTLAKLLGPNHVLVGPMEREELRRAIERPAQRAGLIVEAELVDALLADVEDEPGALPLLSTALLELWQRRDGRHLLHSTYERTGGVRGAVGRLAEEAFGQLDPAQQAVARTVLLRLAGEDAGGAVVRRRVALAELEGASGDDVARVLALFTDRRLLTMSAMTVEVAHEALLREWPRLREWLEEDADGRRVHRHLADAAREWDERGRAPGDVYGGARLAAALEWRGGHEHEVNATERAFLDASRTAAERAQRRLRLALAGVAALLVIAGLGGVVALHQRGSARSEARAAEAQRLGAQALIEPRVDRSLLLARQGVALDDSRVTRSSLLAALLRNPAAVGVIGGDGRPLNALGLSPDGRTLAAADNQGRVLFLDPVTRRPVGRPYTALSPIFAVTYSPDGSLMALSGVNFIDVLDGRTHAYRRRLFAEPGLGRSSKQLGPGRVSFFGAVAFAPDSHVLVTDVAAFPRREDDIVRWDAATGRRLGAPRQVASTANPALVGFLGRGRQLVTSGDRRTVVRDAVTMRPLRRFAGGGHPHALSPDGRALALGAADGSVRLLDLETGRLRAAAGRHDAAVTDLRFTPDSRMLVTAGGDGRVNVWDVAAATRVESFAGHAGAVSGIVISPDGRTVYSAGEDGNVVVWDLTGARGFGRSFTTPRPRRQPAPPQGIPVAVTPDETRFAVADPAGRVDRFDSRTLTQTGRIPISPGTPVTGVALAPDGRTMAATTADGHLRFGDLATSRTVGPLLGDHTDVAWTPAFSGDGRWLATAGVDGAVHLWDMRRRMMMGTYFVLDGFAVDLSINSDGTKLAATTAADEQGHGELDIISIPQLELLRKVHAPLGDWGQFSRDGRTLLYGDDAGRTWLYDTRTWRPRGRPLAGATGPILTANLSPDGQMLATTSTDGTTRLWDVASHRPIGTALPGTANHDVTAAFVEGGSHVITVYDNGRAYSWDVRPRSWAQRACDIAGRTLTRAEWQDALPNRAYIPACGR